MKHRILLRPFAYVTPCLNYAPYTMCTDVRSTTDGHGGHCHYVTTKITTVTSSHTMDSSLLDEAGDSQLPCDVGAEVIFPVTFTSPASYLITTFRLYSTFCIAFMVSNTLLVYLSVR